MIPDWNEILAKCPNLERWNNPNHLGLRNRGTDLPVSISEREFQFLIKFAQENNFKYALDYATGTGISALALGLGVASQAGHVLSIDAYHEKLSQIMPIDVEVFANPVYKDSLGYFVAGQLANQFGLYDRIHLECGVFPKDAISLLRDFTINYGLLNIIMLDAPKTDDSVVETLETLKPFLANKWAIFIHDTHGRESPKTTQYIKDNWNTEWFNALPENMYPFMCVKNF